MFSAGNDSSDQCRGTFNRTLTGREKQSDDRYSFTEWKTYNAWFLDERFQPVRHVPNESEWIAKNVMTKYHDVDLFPQLFEIVFVDFVVQFIH